jgi:hypothetical protein
MPEIQNLAKLASSQDPALAGYKCCLTNAGRLFFAALKQPWPEMKYPGSVETHIAVPISCQPALDGGARQVQFVISPARDFLMPAQIKK